VERQSRQGGCAQSGPCTRRAEHTNRLHCLFLINLCSASLLPDEISWTSSALHHLGTFPAVISMISTFNSITNSIFAASSATVAGEGQKKKKKKKKKKKIEKRTAADIFRRSAARQKDHRCFPCGRAATIRKPRTGGQLGKKKALPVEGFPRFF